MAWMLRHPAVVALEVGWRWLFGIPFLLVCWSRLQHVLTILPQENSGLTNINPQNPWIAAAELSRVWWQYQPLIVNEMRSIVPIAALAWILVSALGRSLALKAAEPRIRFRPAAMLLLQTAWLIVFGSICCGWFWSVGRVASTHFTRGNEPDLIGFAI